MLHDNQFKIFSLCLIMLLLSSCNSSQEKEFREKILGEWKHIETIENGEESEAFLFGFTGKLGYNFSQDGICERKVGYVNIPKSYIEKELLEDFGLLGFDTKYKIIKDSLFIYDLLRKDWNKGKILKLTLDTLVIQYERQQKLMFQKQDYSNVKRIDYDEIRLSTLGCYGKCPKIRLDVKDNGTFYFFGEYYTSKIGKYKGKIGAIELEEIWTKFDNADLFNLKDNYSADISDDELVEVIFLKDGEIVKKISDYGHKSPTEFIWAYSYLRFIHHKIDLKREIN